MASRIFALALLLAALAPLVARAQTPALHGSVIDTTTGTPVSSVQIRLTSPPDTLRATSSADGTFGFAPPHPGTWQLEATRIGYRVMRRTVAYAGGTQDLGALPMAPLALPMPEVEVKGSPPPAVQVGDTTVFSKGAVRTHPDATAEELVSKMPGITVDHAGTVKSNGETVQQVLVDGRPFFGSDATLVLRNLPAEVIDRIQVFDKLSDQSEFTGFDDGQSIKTMNVILRPDHPVTFGKTFGGGGGDQRYQAGGNANVLSGTTRIAAIGMSNNINQQNFSSQDLLGVLNTASQRGSVLGGDGRRTSVERTKRADANSFLVGVEDGITTTNAAGLHVDGVLGKRLDLSQSYFFNEGDNHNLQDVNRQFLVPRDSVTTYSQHLSTHGTTTNHRLDGRITWKSDSSWIDVPQLYFQAHHFNTDLGAENDLASGATATRTEDQNRVRADGHNFTNHLLLRHRLGVAGRTVSLDLGLGHTLKNASGTLDALVDRGPGTESASDTLDQHSHLHTTSSSVSARLVYTEPIGRRGLLQASLAPSMIDARSEHHATQPDPLDTAATVEEGLLTNNFRGVSAAQRGGLGYLYHYKGLRLTVNLDAQRSTLRSERITPDPQVARRTDYDLLPSVLLNKTLPGHRNLRLAWTTSTRPPNITQLQDVVDNSNPLVLTVGNPNLRQQYVHTLLGRYSLTDPARSRSTFVLLSLQKTDRAIGNATWTAARDTVLVGVPVRRGAQLVYPTNVVRTWSANSFVAFSQPVALLRSLMNLNSGATWTRSRGYLDQILATTDTYAFSQGIVLASNISSALDFTVSYTGTYNIARTDAGARNTDYFTQAARLRLNVITRGGIVLGQEVNHTLLNGVASGYTQDVVLWNSSLGEKLFRNHVDLRLTASDVLAQSRNTNRTVTDAYIQDTRNETLPRYLMLTATYTWGP